MPVYNTPSIWLEQSIISCLNQTLQKFELIIVNNESTNKDTISALNRFKNIDKIRIIECPKIKGVRGVSRALNTGISHAQYEYIARMDSDDWMHSTRIEKQYNYLKTNTDVKILGTQMKIIQTGMITNHPLNVDLKMPLYQKNWFINHPTVMMEKTTFISVGGYKETPEMIPEDFDLWCRCLNKNIKIQNLPDCLLNYNQHSAGASRVDNHTSEWKTETQKIINTIL